MSNLRNYLPAMLGSSLLLAQPLAAQAQTSTQDLLNQVESYRQESQAQSPGAAQFSDVSPGDWAYQALDDLVRRYDCLKGYPNGTYRGNRALTRYEFAAGLNACLQQIERLIAGTGTGLGDGDLDSMRRLMQEFEAELAALGARVDSLEGRVSFLEDNQFSTTTKLNGEVLFGLQGAWYGDNFDARADGDKIATDGGSITDDELTFTNRVRLNFDTSFTGRDRLRTRLQARNTPDFNVRSFTNEARLGYRGDNGNTVDVSVVSYRKPLGDRAKLQIYATGVGVDDIISPLSPFASSGGGALSRFGQRNPLTHRGTGEDQAIGLAYELSDNIMLELGYTAGDGEVASKGIFGGDYSIPVQLTFEADKFAIAASYVHGYSGSSGLDHGTGSRAANLDGAGLPTSHNNFGLEALFDVSDSVFVGGWVGYSDAVVLGTGEADVWNYALNIGFPDLGGDGNMLGFVLGRQPYLAHANGQLATNTGLDLGSGEPNDPDVGYHIEAFYKMKISKHIEITPGLIWLTNPGHNDNNSDILIGAVRTRFKF